MGQRRHFLGVIALLCAVLCVPGATAGGAPAGSAAQVPCVGSTLLSPAKPEHRVSRDGRGEVTQAILENLRGGMDPRTLGAQIHRELRVPIDTWLDLDESGVLRWSMSGATMERAMGTPERGVVHGALAQFPWEDVSAALAARSEARPGDVRRKIHTLGILGALAPQMEFQRIADVASMDGRLPRSLQGAYQSSVTAYFRRFPGESASLRAHVTGLPEDLVAPLLWAAVECGGHLSLKGVAGALGAVPEADPLVALCAARIAGHCPKPVPEEAAVPLRRALTSLDGNVRVEGARALGKLDDVGSLPALIEALKDPEFRVRKAAHVALEALSKERHPPSYEIWNHWHRTTNRWRVDRMPNLLGELRSGDPGRSSRALLELSRYRVYRHGIVGAVIECSRTGDEHTAVVAASALGHFGTVEAARQLAELLSHRSLKVKQAAYAGLRRVTGEDHGEDLDAWREAVGEVSK